MRRAWRSRTWPTRWTRSSSTDLLQIQGIQKSAPFERTFFILGYCLRQAGPPRTTSPAPEHLSKPLETHRSSRLLLRSTFTGGVGVHSRYRSSPQARAPRWAFVGRFITGYGIRPPRALLRMARYSSRQVSSAKKRWPWMRLARFGSNAPAPGVCRARGFLLAQRGAVDY